MIRSQDKEMTFSRLFQVPWPKTSEILPPDWDMLVTWPSQDDGLPKGWMISTTVT